MVQAHPAFSGEDDDENHKVIIIISLHYTHVDSDIVYYLLVLASVSEFRGSKGNWDQAWVFEVGDL